jgi:hypothetical protein
MSVYVDELRMHANGKGFFLNRPSCHMYADTIEELHDFAKHLGLRRSWFQPRKGLPHYDLIERRRIKAVSLGAIERTTRQTVEFVRLRKEMMPSA